MKPKIPLFASDTDFQTIRLPEDGDLYMDLSSVWPPPPFCGNIEFSDEIWEENFAATDGVCTTVASGLSVDVTSPRQIKRPWKFNGSPPTKKRKLENGECTWSDEKSDHSPMDNATCMKIVNWLMDPSLDTPAPNVVKSKFAECREKIEAEDRRRLNNSPVNGLDSVPSDPISLDMDVDFDWSMQFSAFDGIDYSEGDRI